MGVQKLVVLDTVDEFGHGDALGRFFTLAALDEFVSEAYGHGATGETLIRNEAPLKWVVKDANND